VARGIYLTSLEPGGGKSVIALGVAEVLSRRVRRLGVFRPLPRGEQDPVVELLAQRYAMRHGTGPTYEHAAAVDREDLVGEIIDAYHALDRECDAVIVVGTDYGHDLAGRHEPGLPDELGLNLRLANELGAALAWVDRHAEPLVVKASGLAAGKGAIVCSSRAEAAHAVRAMLGERQFGAAGEEVVIESFLVGEETSLLALTNGRDIELLPASQDHKRLLEGDAGPSTGGMGSGSRFLGGGGGRSTCASSFTAARISVRRAA